MKITGIYAIVNSANGKMYIGSAMSILDRWKIHRVRLRLGKHKSYKLQAAWNKHGESRFVLVVLETVRDLSTLLDCEQWWLDEYDSASEEGYNIHSVAWSPIGNRLRRSTRTKMIRAAQLPRRRRQGREVMRRNWSRAEYRKMRSRCAKKQLQDPTYRAMLLDNLARGRRTQQQNPGLRAIRAVNLAKASVLGHRAQSQMAAARKGGRYDS